MHWQVRVALDSSIMCCNNFYLKDILVKCIKVEEIGNFSCEILQKLQQLPASLGQKSG